MLNVKLLVHHVTGRLLKVNQASNHQREWRVLAQIHVFSISVPVGEQQSFPVPVTCTGKEISEKMFGSQQPSEQYREMTGGGLRTGGSMFSH